MKMIRHAALAALLLIGLCSPGWAQTAAVLVPPPIPTCDDGDPLVWDDDEDAFVCGTIAEVLQPLTDGTAIVRDNGDATKLLAFQLSGLTTETTRTWTIPDLSGTVALSGASQAVTFGTINASTLGVTGDFAINTDKFTVAGSDGDTLIAGTLGVGGLASFDGDIATDIISEFTAAAGVTIDGVSLKDGGATLTSALLVGNGTSGAPSVAFASDPTKGLYLSGNQIVFTTSVLSGGNVYASIGGSLGFSTRSRIFSPNDGEFTLTPTSGLTGVRLAVSIDTLAIQNFAGTAGATVTAGYFHGSTTAAITASTTQTQGQGALTAQVNEVATVANANDTVTLPAAVAGRSVTVINNGANTLQIFPASGDNLGAGVDTATTLVAGGIVTFIAYDSTNYREQ